MTPLRIDVVSIFPAYLAPLELSLLGRARADGLISLHAHDLRDWTHDRHRTVDDTPYGGGPGMVMRPEPWGEALDALLAAGPAEAGRRRSSCRRRPGRPSTSRWRADLPTEPWLLFACGRYEGIDQRVVDHFAGRLEVLEVSIGDYVLNGGEAAALVIIESVARLLPGFMGNPESLAEESHALGSTPSLLEYPVYTKPLSWRGLDVPEVLLSGHHARIAGWRQAAAVRRTAQRRPDLAHPSQAVTVEGLATEAVVRLATPADAGELLTLQRCCWVGEAQLNDALDLPPLVETLDDVTAALGQWLTVVVRVGSRLVASVRGRLAEPDAVGDRSPDGGPRPGWARAGPLAARPHRAGGAAGGDVVPALHRGEERAQPADVPAGRLSAAAGGR